MVSNEYDHVILIYEYTHNVTVYWYTITSNDYRVIGLQNEDAFQFLYDIAYRVWCMWKLKILMYWGKERVYL